MTASPYRTKLRIPKAPSGLSAMLSNMGHLRYLKSLLRHKLFVFQAGRVMNVPLWRLIIHDWSKFTSAEWGAYVRRFGNGRGGKLIDRNKDGAWMEAWEHHWRNNPHHWEYWLNSGRGLHDELANEMPYHFAREMVADWMGASRAYTGSWDLSAWYSRNRDRMVLHPRTKMYVEELMSYVG